MLYPWQSNQWQQIWQAKQENRLPHALLFAGIAGTGKNALAEHLAKVLLCQQVTGAGECCYQCAPCRLMDGKTHANYLCVTPEKEGATIKVDQIREVSEFVNQSSLQSEYRIVVITPADAMNVSAANALLKTLEEPSTGAILILVSDQPSQMPATILSRCQRIVFAKPNPTIALHWLQEKLTDTNIDANLLLNLANGAPLAALKMVDEEILSSRQALFTALSEKKCDAIKTAHALKDVEPLQLIDFILSWLTDVLRLQLKGENITNTDFSKPLHEQAQVSPLLATTKLLEYALTVRGEISRGFNFNKTLLIEDMLLRWNKSISLNQ